MTSTANVLPARLLNLRYADVEESKFNFGDVDESKFNFGEKSV